MSIKNKGLQTEIHLAEIDRSLALVARVWESNNELSVSEMCEHLKAIGNVVDKTFNFTTFVESTNLTGFNQLN